jgi:tetratricopeptide (TPR) repeat protein
MISSGKLPLLLSAAALAASILPIASSAQGTSPQAHEKLAAAFALDTTGHPAEAIVAAERLLASGALSRVEQADALDLKGMCYRELDQPDKAVHALEAAEALLGPTDTNLQAAILDNLGGIYVLMGNRKVGERLYANSFRLFEAASDHGGMMRVANNQASLALDEKKDRHARKYLERSDLEAKLATNLDKDDLAALASMHGRLALNQGDTGGAVEAYRQALQLWTEFHGEQHPLTAWGTVLLGQAEALNGHYNQGAQTMGKGLALIKATSGENSSRYLTTEMEYARVLDRMGESTRAAQLLQDAQSKQATLTAGNCLNCTISVVALR